MELTSTPVKRGNSRATNRAIYRILSGLTRGQQRAAKRREQRGPSAYDPRAQSSPLYPVKIGHDRVARIVQRDSYRRVPDSEKPSKLAARFGPPVNREIPPAREPRILYGPAQPHMMKLS